MTNKVKVLLVEDNPGDAKLIRIVLSEGNDAARFDLTQTDRLSKAVEMLTAENPDAVLLDLSLPDSQGLGTVVSIVTKMPGVPIIVLTGLDDEAVAVQALQEGAQDYLVEKNQIEGGVLARTISYAIERKQSEAALQASEQRFRALIENGSDVIAMVNSEAKILYTSPAITRILGYSVDEYVGQNVLKLIHPDDTRQMTEVFGQILNQPGVKIFAQAREQHKDGSWRWLEGVATNLLSEPSVQAIVVNFRDITEQKQHLRELETITIVSEALHNAPTHQEMFATIVDHLMELLKVDMTGLAMRDPSSGETLIELTRGTMAKLAGQRLPPGEGLSGRVIASGKPYLSNDLLASPPFHELASSTELRAAACIPLVAEDQTIGAVWIARKQAIETSEVRLLTSIGDIAANAIHRATLQEHTEQHLRHIAALHAIDVAISSSFDLEFILNVMLDQVTNQLGVDAADILLLDPHLNILEFGAGRGFRTTVGPQPEIRLGEGQAGRAALERRTVSIHDLSLVGQAFTRPEMISQEGFTSYYGVPLISKGKVKGVLEIFHRKTLIPDREWLDFLETLAGQAAIAIADATLFSDLQRSNIELTIAYDATIEGWSRALDLRDRETEGHTQRVTEMAVRLGHAIGLSDAELVHVRRGGLLHDIGKMGIPDSILLKPDKLTPEEWEIMTRHPTYAYEMLSPIKFLHQALDIPYCHHEKWDGSGYPRGLTNEEIPLTARIFAVVDIWDALRSDRPYRAAWPEKQIIAYIDSLSGSHLDPQVVHAFMELIGQS